MNYYSAFTQTVYKLSNWKIFITENTRARRADIYLMLEIKSVCYCKLRRCATEKRVIDLIALYTVHQGGFFTNALIASGIINAIHVRVVQLEKAAHHPCCKIKLNSRRAQLARNEPLLSLEIKIGESAKKNFFLLSIQFTLAYRAVSALLICHLSNF